MRGFALITRVLTILTLVCAGLCAALLLAGTWFLSFLVSLLAVLGSQGLLLLSFVTAALGLTAALAPRLRTAVTLRVRVLALLSPVIVLAAMLVALGLSGPVQTLNFNVYREARVQAAKWALAESSERTFSPYGEPLPQEWRHLSDGGEVMVVNGSGGRGVLFYSVSGWLGGRAWLYSEDPIVAEQHLEYPERLDDNWWVGAL